MTQTLIPLGARVRFQRHVERVYIDSVVHSHAWEWVPTQDNPGEGIFVGYRYKQSGYWDVEEGEYSSGGGRSWMETSRIKVALVVQNPWREPLTVDPVGLEVVS
jgi:hypothetical protein